MPISNSGDARFWQVGAAMTINDFDGARFWPGIKQFVIDAGVEPISLGEPEDEIWRKIFAADAATDRTLSFGMDSGALMRAAYALALGGGVAPEPATVTRWVAPTAQGTGDGSSSANAAVRTAIPALVDQIVAANAPGKINLRADISDYGSIGTPITGTVAIDNGFTGASGYTIEICGTDAAGEPMEAVFVGNRTAAPTTSTGGPNLWTLNTGASNITFKDIRAENVRAFARMDPLEAHNIRFERVDTDNVYRAFDNDTDDNFDNPFATRINGLYMTDCHADYVAQGFCLSRNGRDINITDCSSNGRSVNQFNNDPAALIFTPSFGTLPTGDTVDNVYITRFFATGHFMAHAAQFIQGDGANLDDDSAGQITTLVMEGHCATLMGDAGCDSKGESGEYNNAVYWNNYIGLKCWADPTFTVEIDNLTTINSCIVPGTEGGLAKGRTHLYAINSDVTFNLNNWQAYERTTGTAFPKIRQTYSFLPAAGDTIIAGTSSRLILGGDSKTGQVYNINGYDWINCSVGTPLFARDGTGSPTTGATINFTPSLPVVDFDLTWRAGFEGGFVDEDTTVGTVLADLAFTHDKGAVGVGALSILTDPDSKFIIVGNELRLNASISYATSASHVASLRGVYGIVGTDPYNNAADTKTWQCHLGMTVALAFAPSLNDIGGSLGACYKDISLQVIVTGAEETETGDFVTRMTGAGESLTLFTTQWRAAVNLFVRKTKESGAWTKASIIGLHYAPTTGLARRALKSSHDHTITGTPSKVARGKWVGNGTDAYLRRTTFAPSTDGAYLQNDAMVVIEVAAATASANQVFAMGSGSCLTTIAFTAGTTAAWRINNQNSGNTTISGMTGIFSMKRTASTAHNLRRNDVSQGSLTQTSITLTASVGPTILSNTASTTFSTAELADWYVGPTLTAGEETAFNAAITAFKTAVDAVP